MDQPTGEPQRFWAWLQANSSAIFGLVAGVVGSWFTYRINHRKIDSADKKDDYDSSAGMQIRAIQGVQASQDHDTSIIERQEKRIVALEALIQLCTDARISDSEKIAVLREERAALREELKGLKDRLDGG